MLWHRQAIFESKGDKLSSSAECRIWTQGLRHLFASRLNACWQTDWAIEDQAKNLNSTARPYDQQAFSPYLVYLCWNHLSLAKALAPRMSKPTHIEAVLCQLWYGILYQKNQSDSHKYVLYHVSTSNYARITILVVSKLTFVGLKK